MFEMTLTLIECLTLTCCRIPVTVLVRGTRVHFVEYLYTGDPVLRYY